MGEHVLGLDISAASPGAARVYADGHTVRTLRLTLDPARSDHERAARQDRVARWVAGLLQVTTRLVVIEAPAFAPAQPHDAHELAGAWWAVRRVLARAHHADGQPLAVGRAAPTTVKARIAGHGRADKRQLRTAVAKLYPGQGLDRASLDETDAAAVAILGVIRLAAIWPDRWAGPWLDGRALAPDAGTWEHLPEPPARPVLSAVPGPLFAAPGGDR